MKDYNFFNPTAKYKKYQLLSTIESGASLTQREIARLMNIAVSMVNTYLNEYQSEGLVDRIEISKKDVKYQITKKGIEVKRNLNIELLKSVLNVYNLAKSNIYPFFNKLKEKNIKNIIFYGAGEVCEMLLHVLNTDNTFNFNVLCLVDDDINKESSYISNTKILNPRTIKDFAYDALIISSYKNSEVIKNRIKELGIEESKVISLLDMGE